MCNLLRTLCVLAACLCLQGPSSAAIVTTYVEMDDGELSGSHDTPDDLGIFLPGTNQVTGTVVSIGADQGNNDEDLDGTADIFTFEIASGTQLDEIILNAFSTSTGNGNLLLAIDDEATFHYSAFQINDDFVLPDLTQILAVAVVGNGDPVTGEPSQVGTDILDDLQSNGNSIGPFPLGRPFDVPLGAGNYTVYIQETGPQSDYDLFFEVSAAATGVPEPSSTVVLATACLGFVAIRRTRKRKARAAKSRS